MKVVLETLKSGAAWLEKAGVESARLNMELMLAKVLGCRRMQVYVDFDRPLSEDQLVPLREMMKRRAKREPLQHILGEVEFCGREFLCDARGLIPRPETEELAERVLGLGKGKPPPHRLLDMGTGSGVLGISLGLCYPECAVTLVDVSTAALELARENAAKTGLDAARVDFIVSDLFSQVPLGKYDLVLANLPYIPHGEIAALEPEVQRDPVLALDGGPVGTELMERFIAELPRYMESGGLVAMETGLGQTAGVAALLTAAGFTEATCADDMSRRDRFVWARFP